MALIQCVGKKVDCYIWCEMFQHFQALFDVKIYCKMSIWLSLTCKVVTLCNCINQLTVWDYFLNFSCRWPLPLNNHFVVHQDMRVVAYRRVDCTQPHVCYQLALNNLFSQLQLYMYAFVIAMIISKKYWGLF